ncbi:MAG: hypothetical protein ABF876_10950 [Acetobacter aceti]|uniref:hypothetical protein n=1 Tax=Acetobacter aceti TaxID=435 RepID=UPI001F22116D|nr:hypothetical protein [Acetobacter aceti]
MSEKSGPVFVKITARAVFEIGSGIFYAGTCCVFFPVTDWHALIPLTVTTPEASGLWTEKCRRTAFLLDMTGEALSEEGWMQVERPAPENRVFSGRSPKNISFMRNAAEAGQSLRHDSACACCVGRPALVSRLLSLVQERARGQCAFFRHIALVVSADQQGTVTEGLKASSLLENLLSPEMER